MVSGGKCDKWRRFSGARAEALAPNVLYFFPSIAGEELTRCFLAKKEDVLDLMKGVMGKHGPNRIEIISSSTVSIEQRLALLSLYFPDRSDTDLLAMNNGMDWSKLDERPAHAFSNYPLVMLSDPKGSNPITAIGYKLSVVSFSSDIQRFAEVLRPTYFCRRRANDLADAGEFMVGKIVGVSKCLEVEEELLDYAILPIRELKESKETKEERAERIFNEIIALQRANGLDVLVNLYGKSILEMLAAANPQPGLSRLQVTDDFRIILLDYQNKEVKVGGTLEKSLFFLFLLLPQEGVCLNDLDKYRNVLLEIYKMISNREDTNKMEDSVNRLVEPCSDLCQQKLSRIRKGFKDLLNDDLECEYVPKGKKSAPYSIRLDRKLLLLPESLSKLKV